MRATRPSLSLPKLSAMAAVKYAPPAIPPRKKYQTIISSQPGGLGIAISLPTTAEREDGAQPHHEGRAHGEERVDDDVALGKHRVRGEIVGRRLREKEEEGVEPSEEALGIGPVELGVREAHRLERLDAALRLLHELVAEAELDGLRRARFGARGPEPVVDAVVAEGALRGAPRVAVEAHDAEGAGGDAVPAAVADVLVDVDGAELRAVDGARRAGVQAPRLRAVLAHVRHEQPRHLAARLGLLHEPHEAERLVGEVVVVLVAARPLGQLRPELVPLLARDLARAAADAQRGVGEHREGPGHGYTVPFLTLHTKAFVSWMKTLGSPTVAERSLVMCPRLPGSPSTPLYPQCQGTPIWCTVLPSTRNGLRRFVTMAFTWILPRGLSTVTMSPLSI